MAKHGKKRRDAANAPEKPAPPSAFNPAFAGLKAAWERSAPEPPPEPAPPAPPPPPTPEEEDDLELLELAMSQVKPLATRLRRREPQPQPKPPNLNAAQDDDLEVLASLADLVSGSAELDLRMTDLYVQGHLPGVGPELMERLGNGDFPQQDYLDLHGLSLVEARPALEEFLVKAQAKGLRHVLVVHGKGLGSPEGVPVLKRALANWLASKALGKRVLAFCTALPRDGGEGAMYLLLRKPRAPGAPRW